MPEDKKSKNPIVQPVGDPWEYSKKGNQFITRRKGNKDWIVASGSAKNAIATRIFNADPKTGKKITKPTQLQEATVVGKRPQVKSFTPDMKGRTHNPLQGIQLDNQMYGPYDMEGVSVTGQRPLPPQPDQPTQLQGATITGKRPIPKDAEVAPIIGRPLKNKITGKPYELPEVTIVGKNPSGKKPAVNKKGNFMGVDVEFAKDFYQDKGVKKDFIFVVDKPTGKIYRLNINTNKVDALGEVGLGRNVGDRDVSGGRSTGQGSNMTQAGWSKINRVQSYPNRNEDYGDEFHGFSSFVDGKWKEIPTGIHGSENETCGRVSGGCTRLPAETEQVVQDELDMNTLLYYTQDQQYANGGKIPPNTKLKDGVFYNPEGDTIRQYIQDEQRFINEPVSGYRPSALSSVLNQSRRSNIEGGLVEPLPTQIPMRQQYGLIGDKEFDPMSQYLPEFGFGSWLKDNLGTISAVAGAIPGIGNIAGPILGGVSSFMDAQESADADQTLLDDQAAVQKEQQDLANRQTRATNIIDDKQINYGATFEKGGPIGQGFMGQPQITEYTTGGKHNESATRGIPVDARGNPATTSKSSAVGLTEQGEVTWNGYVFSDKLKNE